MLDKLAEWLDRRGSRRMIERRNKESGKDEAYLKRFYILRFERFALFIHQFWSSDPDHPHDHPWANYTLVLSGGYHEISVDGEIAWRGPLCRRYRPAELFHRIVIKPENRGTAWTLFAHFKRTRVWGFLTPEGWMPSKEYGEKYESPVEEGRGADFKLVGHFFPRVVWL